MKKEKTNKKTKQQIVIERYEILQKAKKLKAKGIKYKEMEEILGVKERTTLKKLLFLYLKETLQTNLMRILMFLISSDKYN